MSVFKLPKRLCKEINKIMSTFWWGHMENDRKIQRLKWSKMDMSKIEGGHGFRILKAFDLAML